MNTWTTGTPWPHGFYLPKEPNVVHTGFVEVIFLHFGTGYLKIVGDPTRRRGCYSLSTSHEYHESSATKLWSCRRINDLHVSKNIQLVFGSPLKLVTSFTNILINLEDCGFNNPKMRYHLSPLILPHHRTYWKNKCPPGNSLTYPTKPGKCRKIIDSKVLAGMGMGDRSLEAISSFGFQPFLHPTLGLHTGWPRRRIQHLPDELRWLFWGWLVGWLGGLGRQKWDVYNI